MKKKALPKITAKIALFILFALIIIKFKNISECVPMYALAKVIKMVIYSLICCFYFVLKP